MNVCRVLLLSSKEPLELSYKVPLSLAENAKIGMQVIVPVGERMSEGVITAIADEQEDSFELKDIFSVTSAAPLFNHEVLEMSLLADAESFAKAGAHLAAYLWRPPSPRVDRKVTIINDAASLTPSEARLVEEINVLGGHAALSRLNTRLGKAKVIYALKGLQTKGVVKITEEVTSSRARPQRQFAAKDAVPLEIRAIAGQHDSMAALARAAGVPVSRVAKMVKEGLLELAEDLPTKAPAIPPPGFSWSFEEGKAERERIEFYKQKARAHLGVGTSLVIVCPNAFCARRIFREQGGIEGVFLCATGATPQNDATLWERVKAKANCIVIGLGQALFLPLVNLAEIIIEEPLSPHFENDVPFQLRLPRLAKLRSELSQCKLTWSGSPTSIESLKEGADPNETYPNIELVNMVFEPGSKEQPLVSQGMIKAVTEEIKLGRPVLVYIARKGYSNFVFCDDCGQVLSCPKCRIPLTYHFGMHNVSCRFCGHESPAPDTCPSCGGVSVLFKAGGSERLHIELENKLPNCRILRADGDVFDASKNMRSFGQPGDVLIGTSMILDRINFENVGLVCIASLDGLLSMPIFSATHKAYSVVKILQGKAPSAKILLQTYMPTNPFIKALQNKDLGAFLNLELLDRSEAFYPPFSEILWWSVVSRDQMLAEAQAKGLFSRLEETLDQGTLSKPNAGYFHRLKGEYRWDILLKMKNLRGSLGALRQVFETERLKGARIEVVNPNA